MERIGRGSVGCAAVFSLCTLLTGCIGGATTTRLYQGDLPLAQVAVIFWDGSVPPLLLAVDGAPVPQGKLKINRVELTPGTHRFSISPIAGPESVITVQVEAGRCYVPRQRLISTERAPEMGNNMFRERYEAPFLLERQEQACTMRDK